MPRADSARPGPDARSVATREASGHSSANAPALTVRESGSGTKQRSGPASITARRHHHVEEMLANASWSSSRQRSAIHAWFFVIVATSAHNAGMSSPFVRYFTLCAATVLALVSIGISVELIVPRSGAGLIAIIGLVVVAAGVAMYRRGFAKRETR